MTPSISARRAKAAELRLLHDRYDSWRDVQANHYPTIPAGTLCAIAKGKNIPAKHYRALGLIGQRKEKPVAPSPEWWERVEKQAMRVMVRNTKRAVIQK